MNAMQMTEWRNEGGNALVPNTRAGRAWMAQADEIQRNGTEADWDKHSLELITIGGKWK